MFKSLCCWSGQPWFVWLWMLGRKSSKAGPGTVLGLCQGGTPTMAGGLQPSPPAPCDSNKCLWEGFFGYFNGRGGSVALPGCVMGKKGYSPPSFSPVSPYLGRRSWGERLWLPQGCLSCKMSPCGTRSWLGWSTEAASWSWSGARGRLPPLPVRVWAVPRSAVAAGHHAVAQQTTTFALFST